MRSSVNILLVLVSLVCYDLNAQDPTRFKSEIDQLKSLNLEKGENSIVFTGSSSIRLWHDLNDECHGYPYVNTGFGGSHMSDLLYYLDELILRFSPTHVFIYEGDNDISFEKSPEAILKTTKEVVDKIFVHNPNTEIFFISAKPSPSRWRFQKQFIHFNDLLKKYCESLDNLHYVDVWYPMLNKSGRPMSDIFIADSLHMNSKGYKIWDAIICDHLKK